MWGLYVVGVSVTLGVTTNCEDAVMFSCHYGYAEQLR